MTDTNHDPEAPAEPQAAPAETASAAPVEPAAVVPPAPPLQPAVAPVADGALAQGPVAEVEVEADAEAEAAAVPAPGRERVLRGILFALPVIPVGVIAWVVIWQWGFISAIVAFGVAAGAAFLYRRGSGGRVSWAGVVSIIAVTLVTLVLAFLGGIASDLAAAMGVDFISAMRWPEFWDVYMQNVLGNPELWSSLTPDLLMSLLFAALGCFSVLRNLMKQARTAGTD